MLLEGLEEHVQHQLLVQTDPLAILLLLALVLNLQWMSEKMMVNALKPKKI